LGIAAELAGANPPYAQAWSFSQGLLKKAQISRIGSSVEPAESNAIRRFLQSPTVSSNGAHPGPNHANSGPEFPTDTLV
jgi:hypothetical protein